MFQKTLNFIRKTVSKFLNFNIMKKLYLFCLALALCCFASCSIEDTIHPFKEESENTTKSPDSVTMTEGEIVLGEKLDNPFSVSNMQKAYNSLLKDKNKLSQLSTLGEIKTTHYYVRFLPKSEEELDILQSHTDWILYEYPLDYEILEYGISYHDPSLPDSSLTYQYAAIEADKFDPYRGHMAIEYEILENLYIPEEAAVSGEKPGTGFKPSTSTVIEMLVNESLRLTGNLDDTVSPTSGQWYPSGRIMAYDDIVEDTIPLEGVQVRMRYWFTTRWATTDKDGYFKCGKSFSHAVNYSIVWQGDRWDIRDGCIGQAYYNGPKQKTEWNLTIGNGTTRSLRYSAIHRAAYRYYNGDTYGLSRPANSRKEKIGYIHKEGDVYGSYFRQIGAGIGIDIAIYGISNGKYREPSNIYSTACHELGHASHYTNSKSKYKSAQDRVLESWARFVQYHLTNKEYEELGMQDSLNQYRIFDLSTIYNPNEPPAYQAVRVIIPDMEFNFQKWNTHIGDTFSSYTPLFIDMSDDMNQRYYYELWEETTGIPKHPEYYPDDDVAYLPAEAIEDFVFNSTSFAEIKWALERYVLDNPELEDNIMYNFTAENINKLFECYL